MISNFIVLIAQRVVTLGLMTTFLVLSAFAQGGSSAKQKARSLRISPKTVQTMTAPLDTMRAHVLRPGDSNLVRLNPPQTYRMDLRSSLSQAPTGYPLTFEIEHSFPRDNTALLFSVDYGDGTRDLLPFDAPSTTHRFVLAGSFNVVARIIYSSGSGEPTRETRFRDSIIVRIDGVSLDATPASVAVKEEVTFSVLVEAQLPDLMYRVFFGDDPSPSAWGQSPQIRHRYRQAGSFAAFAEVGRDEQGAIVPITQTLPREITVTPAPIPPPGELSLRADNLQVNLGATVYFTASMVPPSPGVRYRFEFGDGESSEWQASGSQSHQYGHAGGFKVYAEASSAIGVVQSNPLVVRVESTVTPPWMWVIGAAAIIAVASLGIRSVRQTIFPPKVTITVKRDASGPRVKSAMPPRIAVCVILRRNVHKGLSSTDSRENTLIKSIRRKHA